MSDTVFSPKDPDSTEIFSFDYSRDLGQGETITGATVTVSLVSGTDSNPSAMLTGVVLINGKIVGHKVTGGVLGNVYCLECLATTSAGQVIPKCGQVSIVDCCDQ